MAGNENSGNNPGDANRPRGVTVLPKWSEAAEILAKPLGAAGILGVAVIFAMPMPNGEPKVQMMVSAMTDKLREDFSAAVAPLIGADLEQAQRKVIVPGGLN